jgi:hypothetical protein
MIGGYVTEEPKMSTQVETVSEEMVSAIVTMLNNKQEVSALGDLACWAEFDGSYAVQYFYDDTTVNHLNMTQEELKIVMEEEELVMYYPTPEEAARFYLRLLNGKVHYDGNGNGRSTRRTLQQKLKAYDEDKYF